MKTQPLKVAVYLRVSTSHQTTDSQRGELLEYCRRRGWDSPTIFEDAGVSGSKVSRPKLDEMLALARRGKLDAIVAFRLDRLGRSLPHLVTMLDELSRLGVAVIVPGQGIDLSIDNPAARLQVSILSAIAQFERELISERVHAGLAAARKRGSRLGRPVGKAFSFKQIFADHVVGK